MSDRVHNVILNLIALFIGIDALIAFGDAFFAGEGAFRMLFRMLLGIFLVLLALGFKKRKGWAFLTVSVWLLVAWMIQLVTMIVVYDAGETGLGHAALINFVLINLMIGYLGRWSMERRFRPHLDH